MQQKRLRILHNISLAISCTSLAISIAALILKLAR